MIDLFRLFAQEPFWRTPHWPPLKHEETMPDLPHRYVQPGQSTEDRMAAILDALREQTALLQRVVALLEREDDRDRQWKEVFDRAVRESP